MRITVYTRRWFQRSYGNTYHSCRVYVDGKEIGHAPFVYGYGDQWQQTAHDLLTKAGYFPKTGERLSSGMDKDYYDFLQWTRTGDYTAHVIDVPCKKYL